MTTTIEAIDHPSALQRHTVRPDCRTVGRMVGEDGFARVPELATRSVAADARAALIAATTTLVRDRRAPWRNPKGTDQIAWASRLVPGLGQSPIRSAARALAADIIGGPVVERFDYALVTPAGAPGAPWHRDADSFTLRGIDRRVHIWVALQDVDETNGCLSYVPRGSQQHPPEPSAILCSIRAGGALVHDERCLHRSAPNATDAPRWAWVLQFAAAGPLRRMLFAFDRARARLLLTPARRRLAAAHERSAA